MTRSHRFIHRLLWPALAVVVALGLTMALVLRPPPDPPPACRERQTMSAGFRAVQWNRDKLIYDAILIVGVAIYVASFVLIARHLHPPQNRPDEIDIWIRAYGSCAFLMLTVILSIGPLARLDRRFLPLLYNRRHFGVLTFFIAVVHASLMVDWFVVQNALPDLVSEMTTVASYGKFIGFPFKALGLAALLVLFLMAATSHDFWLAIPHPADMEGAAHGALCRLWPGGDACGARHHGL